MLQPVADQLAAGLAGVAPWTSAAVFAGSVASWAHAEAQAYLLRQYVDEVGLVDEEGQPRPAAGCWKRSRAAWPAYAASWG